MVEKIKTKQNIYTTAKHHAFMAGVQNDAPEPMLSSTTRKVQRPAIAWVELKSTAP